MPAYERLTLRPRFFWRGANGGTALLTLGAMNLVRRRDSKTVSPFKIAGDRDDPEEAPA